jgi:hypothetical protein
MSHKFIGAIGILALLAVSIGTTSLFSAQSTGMVTMDAFDVSRF